MRKILLLPFLLLNCFILNAQVCTKSQLPVNLQNGLVAYYTFCGNANDVSGNGNNGIIYGTVSLTSDRFGINSSAYSFPGNASSYIDCGSGSSLKIQKSLSICAWIYMEGGYYNPRILSINGPNNIAAYNLAVAGTSNTSRILEGFFVNQDGSGTGFCCGNDGIVVPAKSWQFVVYTADSFGVSKLYLNGELKKTKSGLPVNNAGYITNLNIGRLTVPAYDAWGGYLDDIMLYNRALTSCEVSQIYNATSTSFPVLEEIVFNPLKDTISICGTSANLDAGAGFSGYSWNTGATTQSISPTKNGWYKVTVTNATGCTATDSTYLSLVNAKILQKDTTICKGSSIKLSIDSSFSQSAAVCSATLLPSTLQNGLVAYYPFCGNANDATSNGNDGIVLGPVLTADRFGNTNKAYSFNGVSDYISTNLLPPTGNSARSVSLWFKFSDLQEINVYSLLSYGANSGDCSQAGGNFSLEVFKNVSNNLINFRWDGVCSAAYNENNIDSNWHHVVVTYNPLQGNTINTAIIYIDGRAVTTNSYNGNTLINTLLLSKLKIGMSVSTNSRFFKGAIDDIYIYNRALSEVEIKQLYTTARIVTWSTGATSNNITVSPSQTITYYVTVTDGITTCTDSVTVTVDDITGFNPLQDTTSVCGSSAILDAGAGFSSYQWNNGATIQTISPTTSGWYKVIVKNAAGCTATDSTYLSLVNAKILQKDTTICKGAILKLTIDSVFSFYSAPCSALLLPSNLKSGLVAYYPFCGDAKDATGNFHDGNVFGATLTTDRFGNANNAYSFNGNGNYISVPDHSALRTGKLSLSGWYFTQSTNNNQCFFSKSNPNTTAGEQFYCTGNIFGIKRNPTVNCSPNTGWQYLWSNSQFQIGKWTHVAFTWDGNTQKIYKDGILVSSQNALAGNIDSCIGGDLKFGYWWSSDPKWLNGKLDDVMFHNRALSSSEIQQLYKETKSVSWSTGATTNSITVNPTQTTKYYVIVSDGITSCTDSVTITVEDITGFDPLRDTTSVCGTSAILDAGAGFSSYQWNNGATTRTITATSGGFYKVTATNAAGCTASDSTLLSLVNANIINNDTTICKGASIKLNIDSLFKGSTACNSLELPVNLRNGLVGYYPFCGNANDASGNGNHGLVNGATLTTDRNGNGNSAFAFNGNGQYIDCGNNAILEISGSLSISVWVNTNNFNTDHGIVSKMNTGPITYDLVTNAPFSQPPLNKVRFLGQFSSRPLEVNKWAHIVSVFNSSLKKIYCYIDGNLVDSINTSFSSINTSKDHLFIGAHQPAIVPTWAWDGKLDDVFIWNRALNAKEVQQVYSTRSVIWSTGEFSNNITVRPTQTTTYYVTVSDGITTCTDSVKVTVASADTSLAINGNTTFCNGQSVQLQAGANIAYQWFKDGAPVSGAVNQTFTATASGIYHARVTSALNCIDSTRKVTVTVNANPTAVISAISNTTFCTGGNVTLSATAGVGFTYQWRINGTNIPGATASSYTATQSGAYTVIVTNANNCSSAISAAVNVTVNELPATPVVTAAGPTTFCTGGSVILNATAGAASYAWYNNGILIPGATASSYTATQSGAYTVIVTNANNCSSAISAAVNVTVNALPVTPTVTAAGPTTFCSGGSVTLNATAGATSYAWYNNGTLINGATASSYTATQSGAYSVIITNTNNCSSTASTAVNITVNALPATPTITAAGATTFCAGGSVTLNATAGAASYKWYNNGTLINGATASSYTATQSGAYTVIFTNANNCSSAASAAITVVVNALPATPTVTAAGPTTVCAGGSVTLNATAGAASYAWYNNGTLINGATTQVYTATTNGSYSVMITNQNGCSSAVSVPVVVVVNPLPTGNIIQPSVTIICGSNPISLNVSGTAQSYQWYRNGVIINGATGNTFSALLAGTYTVELTSTTGCKAFAQGSVQLQQLSAPQPDISFNSRCVNTPVQFTVTGNVTQSGTLAYAWSFGDGAVSNLTAPQHTYLQNGTYNLQLAVSSAACPSFNQTISKPITVQSPTPGLLYPPLNIVENTSTQIFARNFGVAYSWTPSTGLSNPFVVNPFARVTAPVTYQIRITDLAGCVTVDTQEVRLFKENNIYVPKAFTPNGDGANDYLYPNLVGIRELRMFRIYNRWGILMYDAKSQMPGWDGMYMGVKQPMETYMWIAEGYDTNGTIIKRNGNVLLIR